MPGLVEESIEQGVVAQRRLTLDQLQVRSCQGRQVESDSSVEVSQVRKYNLAEPWISVVAVEAFLDILPQRREDSAALGTGAAAMGPRGGC